MRAIWLLMALSVTMATGYVTWYGIAERRANAPETFVNLVRMLALFCAVGAGILWGRIIRKIKESARPASRRQLRLD